jgi:hypothetical protein
LNTLKRTTALKIVPSAQADRSPANLQPNRFSRWNSSLLRLVFGLFLFETLTGFIVFFIGPILPGYQATIEAHWVVGFLTLIPFTVYQWKHYQRIRFHPKELVYQLGMLTFYSLLFTFLTGLPLIILEPSTGGYQALDLIHLMFSSLFTIALGSHLTILLRRLYTSDERQASQIIIRSIVGYPVVLSILLTAVFVLLAN